jgi:Rrf2 family protein
MKLSSRTDYALRALFTLVGIERGDLLSTRQLAERNDIPKKFLEQILMELKAQGWIESVTGKNGGYRLAKPAGQITMGEVIRHFDGILAPIACVSVTGYKCCSQEPVCRFRRLFLDARNYVAGVMDKATLESVFHGSPVTREEVFDVSIIQGEGI